jgi:hypothetical protein
MGKEIIKDAAMLGAGLGMLSGMAGAGSIGKIATAGVSGAVGGAFIGAALGMATDTLKRSVKPQKKTKSYGTRAVMDLM